MINVIFIRAEILFMLVASIFFAAGVMGYYMGHIDGYKKGRDDAEHDNFLNNKN